MPRRMDGCAGTLVAERELSVSAIAQAWAPPVTGLSPHLSVPPAVTSKVRAVSCTDRLSTGGVRCVLEISNAVCFWLAVASGVACREGRGLVSLRLAEVETRSCRMVRDSRFEVRCNVRRASGAIHKTLSSRTPCHSSAHRSY